jgi:Domain of unknown function (DUF4124)
MNCTRSTSKPRVPGLLIVLVWPLFVLPSIAAGEDSAQIFKCTDKSGNVTYQNEPCPKDSKAGRIDIFDNRWSTTREEREAEWRRSASQRQLATGMPARWVREALGEPTEVRDTPTAGAAQLWLYSLRDRSVQIGMLNDQVLWFRETPTSSPTARVVPPVDRAASKPQVTPSKNADTVSRPPADLPVMRMVPTESDRVAETRPAPPAADRMAEARAAPSEASSAPPATVAMSPAAPGTKTALSVARGQDCKQVLADLGPPDRQRDVAALDAGSDPATEYFYESSAAGAGRLRIVCANGKVEGVDRSVAR